MAGCRRSFVVPAQFDVQAVTANWQSTALQRPRSNPVMRSTIRDLAHRKLVSRNALQNRILPTAQSSEFRSTPVHQRPAASSPARDTSMPKPSSRATSIRGSHGSAGSGTPPQLKRQLAVSTAATKSIAGMAGGGRDFDVVVWVSGAARTQSWLVAAQTHSGCFLRLTDCITWHMPFTSAFAARPAVCDRKGRCHACRERPASSASSCASGLPSYTR